MSMPITKVWLVASGNQDYNNQALIALSGNVDAYHQGLVGGIRKSGLQ
jgi:hypothetical protein